MESSTSVLELPADIPSILDELRLEGLRFLQGSIRISVPLLKRPPPAAGDETDNQSLVSAWDRWWKRTPCGSSPDTLNQRWNSTARTGEVWN